MNEEANYLSINKESWNQRAAVHVDSEFYDNKTFLQGRSSLNDIELDLLGDVSGKSILHLQCHFGQDSISLSRMGARVTGVDFSETAIEQAKVLSSQCETDTQFVCCDIYDLPNHLAREFDIVFTSYGTIGWLPDIQKWAYVVQHFLKKDGQFVFAEFHPMVWMFDNNFEYIQYAYNQGNAIVETESGTYADKNAAISPKTITWNYGLGEVVMALIFAGLQIDVLREFDYSPYNCFNKTVEFEKGKFHINGLENKIPMVYALLATNRKRTK